MTVYNTPGDAANTAVRSFLTKVGEYYLQKSFNTGSGYGKLEWERIKTNVFNNKCAYCNIASSKLQIEHLIMFNRTEYGLHHPGNVVPACSECNKRAKTNNNRYANWKEHLEGVCRKNKEDDKFADRKKKINDHIKREKYPNLTEAEKNSIRVIANSLYENIKQEMEKSIALYKELDKSFVRKKK